MRRTSYSCDTVSWAAYGIRPQRMLAQALHMSKIDKEYFLFQFHEIQNEILFRIVKCTKFVFGISLISLKISKQVDHARPLDAPHEQADFHDAPVGLPRVRR